MSKFRSLDLFNIDELFSEEELMIRETVREWVTEQVLPIIEDYYQKGEFPLHLVSSMGELGFLGSNLPADYGCSGINNVAYGLIMQELERGDSGIRSFASVQGALVMYPIYTWGTEEQKRYWLPKLAAGEKIGCFGLTEPDFGSNPASGLTTREEEILSLLAKGYLYKEIADRANISIDTVRSHIRHIYEKLQVKTRTEAVLKYLHR